MTFRWESISLVHGSVSFNSLFLYFTSFTLICVDVVACKEAMWDELQRRAQVIQSPTQEGYAEPTSPVMQRVTLLDEVEWIGSEKRMSDREKFELLFLRFEE